MVRFDKKRIYEDDNINMTSINIKKSDVRENVYYSKVENVSDKWERVVNDFVSVNLEIICGTILFKKAKASLPLTIISCPKVILE